MFVPKYTIVDKNQKRKIVLFHLLMFLKPLLEHFRAFIELKNKSSFNFQK